ncbi:taste receptor type 2 member 7-like [Pleurodeles waltl]
MDILRVSVLATLMVLMLFGILGNAFVAITILRNTEEHGAIPPVDFITFSMMGSNILLQVFKDLRLLLNQVGMSCAGGEIFYRLNLFLVTGSRCASVWLTAILSVLYYLKIVRPTSMMGLKIQRAAPTSFQLLAWVPGSIGFLMAVIIFRIPVADNEGNSTICNFYFLGSSTLLTYNILNVIFGGIIPVITMVTCSLGVVVYLCRHRASSVQNQRDIANLRNRHQDKATKTLLILVSFFVVSGGLNIATRNQSILTNKNLYLWSSLASSLYITASPFILISGNHKLRQRMRELCRH